MLRVPELTQRLQCSGSGRRRWIPGGLNQHVGAGRLAELQEQPGSLHPFQRAGVFHRPTQGFMSAGIAHPRQSFGRSQAGLLVGILQHVMQSLCRLLVSQARQSPEKR